jgi:PAS domain S-box-containing protein
MNAPLRILHLEDDKNDATLVQALLCQDGIACELERVDTRAAFRFALEQGGFDLILSDFSMPGFDGMSALALTRDKRPDLPFIFVSGTIGEDAAIESLKQGATDYVLKHRLERLVPAVRRALAETQERLARQRAEEAMVQSEFKYRQLFECLSEAAILADPRSGRVLDANKQAENLLRRTRGELIGSTLDRLHPAATQEQFRRALAEPNPAAAPIRFKGEICPKDGHPVAVEVSAAPILLYGRQLVLGLYQVGN